jgi:hypothetical protein
VEVVGQGASQRPDEIVTPVLPQLDIEDFDFEHIARLRASDCDRPGQDVARHHPFAFGMNLGQFGRNMKAGAVRYDFRATADGVDGELIATFDGEDGLQLGLEEAPMARFRAGTQVMMLHDGASELSQWSESNIRNASQGTPFADVGIAGHLDKGFWWSLGFDIRFPKTRRQKVNKINDSPPKSRLHVLGHEAPPACPVAR